MAVDSNESLESLVASYRMPTSPWARQRTAARIVARVGRTARQAAWQVFPKSSDDVDEAEQEAMRRLFREIDEGRIDEHSHISGFVRTAARNWCLSVTRRRREILASDINHLGDEGGASTDVVNNFPDPTADPEELFLKQEEEQIVARWSTFIHALLREFMERLPPAERALFEWICSGRTQIEFAKYTGVEENAVNARMKRIKQRLRPWLEAKGIRNWNDITGSQHE